MGPCVFSWRTDISFETVGCSEDTQHAFTHHCLSVARWILTWLLVRPGVILNITNACPGSSGIKRDDRGKLKDFFLLGNSITTAVCRQRLQQINDRPTRTTWAQWSFTWKPWSLKLHLYISYIFPYDMSWRYISSCLLQQCAHWAEKNTSLLLLLLDAVCDPAGLTSI